MCAVVLPQFMVTRVLSYCWLSRCFSGSRAVCTAAHHSTVGFLWVQGCCSHSVCSSTNACKMGHLVLLASWMREHLQ